MVDSGVSVIHCASNNFYQGKVVWQYYNIFVRQLFVFPIVL
uniref:Uncharacterized protein n=1 Tax=Anguilla anguilla TaxID=7936 RepID=A0A0E9WCD9_ANGAN